MIYGEERLEPVGLLEALLGAGVPKDLVVEAEVYLPPHSRAAAGGTGLWDMARHVGGKAFKKVGRSGEWIETAMPLYTGRIRPPSP